MSQVQIMPQRRSKKRYMWWLSVLLILIVTWAYLVSWPEIILLRAGGPLALGSSPVLPPTGSNHVTTLSVGDEAYVTECKDIKTDLVIRLRTKTGETGYVAGGNYILIRKNVSLYSLISEFNLVTFTCRGMLENRSQPAN
jgi:hypothetical protein